MRSDAASSSPGADASSGAPGAGNAVTTEDVINIAITEFANHGFVETKLDNISKISGMSKRMIHYHFGDKKGLYINALRVAADRLTPTEEELALDSNVPIEGVRKVVEHIFQYTVDNPDCVRMLAIETHAKVIDVTNAAPVTELSPVALNLDRLLMLGQDSGAFRPGISALDIFTMVNSLAMFRINNHDMAQNLMNVDLFNHDNTEGMRRMVVDCVMAFLTANIPDIGFESYLTPERDPEESDSAEIYQY